MLEMYGKKYIHEKEVKRYFPYGPDWFRKARHQKKDIPFIKFGNKILYSIEELEGWFKQNIVVSHNQFEDRESAH